jgi:SOS-response transcriptional repressor LexA
MLTRREAQALVLIAAGLRRDGMAPTVRELTAGLGLSPVSLATAKMLVDRLVAKGVLQRLPGRARALALVPGAWLAVQPPGEDMRLERVA